MKEERIGRLLIISKRLLLFTALSLIATTIVFSITFFLQNRLMISRLTFECGIIGGFVSIQQRLKSIEDEELKLLSESWATILVIPIYGGIFALVLYLLFLGGLIKGDLFPKFYMPDFNTPPTTENMVGMLIKTYPEQGTDFCEAYFLEFCCRFFRAFCTTNYP